MWGAVLTPLDVLLAACLAVHAAAFAPSGAVQTPHVQVPPAISRAPAGAQPGAQAMPREQRAGLPGWAVPRRGATPRKKSVYFVDSLDGCRAATKRILSLSRGRRVAVDMEGYNLGGGAQETKIALFQVAIENRAAGAGSGLDERFPVYVFDIATLGRLAFKARELGGGGLEDVLQSFKIQKICFAATSASENLRREYNVRMNNLLDLQLLYTLYNGTQAPGFAAVFQDFLDSTNFSADGHSERLGRARQKRNMSVWAERPLDQDLIEHAAADAHLVMPMAEHFAALIREANPLRGAVAQGTPVRAILNGRVITGAFDREGDRPDEVLVFHRRKVKTLGLRSGRVPGVDAVKRRLTVVPAAANQTVTLKRGPWVVKRKKVV